MSNMLENNGKLAPKEFDLDPHVILLPSLHPDTGKPEFVLIQDKGITLTLDDGSILTPEGIIAVNQTNRVAYINAYKKDGYTFISIIRKGDE